MTVLQFVERERTRLRRLHVAAGIALAAAVTLGLLALGVLALGDARWITLPRSAPFVLWAFIIAMDAAIVRWSWRHLVGSITRGGVAAEIEREQALRAGALRGVLEVGNSGTLGRHAESHLSRRLQGAGVTLAPTAQRK